MKALRPPISRRFYPKIRCRFSRPSDLNSVGQFKPEGGNASVGQAHVDLSLYVKWVPTSAQTSWLPSGFHSAVREVGWCSPFQTSPLYFLHILYYIDCNVLKRKSDLWDSLTNHQSALPRYSASSLPSSFQVLTRYPLGFSFRIGLDLWTFIVETPPSITPTYLFGAQIPLHHLILSLKTVVHHLQ